MELQLYHRENCPFSAKVRKFIDQHDLKPSIEFHDVDEDDQSLLELESLNDDDQVPCLVVDGKPILESAEIIQWLDEHEEEIH